jgi:predicted tellurium resistance membrane protein TerC
VLVFIGVKMLIGGLVHISIAISLGVVITVLAGSVIASLMHKSKSAPRP